MEMKEIELPVRKSAKKKKGFDRNKYAKEFMRKKRAENPGYGRPKSYRVTPAYCRKCCREQSWQDAVTKDGILCCPACGDVLYSICRQ